MKKLLLASTALVMSAGVAAADVAVSGDGRMGITYNNSLATNKAAFTSRVRVAFTLSGETDGGLAFGGSIRADNAAGGAAGTAGSVFISGAFGKLSMGDVSGAAELVVGDVAGVGLTGLGDRNETTYLDNSGALPDARPTARYEYTMDGLTVAISHSNPGVAGKTASIGVGYAFDGFKVGIGYERQNATAAIAAVAPVPGNAGAAAVAARAAMNHLVVGAEATFSGITGKVVVGRASGAGSAALVSKTQTALSLSGKFDALTVTAFGRSDFAKDRHIGLGASYDLGGGASLVGGVVQTNFNAPAVANRTVADFGVSFKF